jgi:hypothetical protein
MAFAPKDFARQELAGFFQREERGDCAACLAEQLIRRGSASPRDLATRAVRQGEAPGFREDAHSSQR